MGRRIGLTSGVRTTYDDKRAFDSTYCGKIDFCNGGSIVKKLRKEQWVSLGLILCVLGVIAGCTVLKRFSGEGGAPDGNAVEALEQSTGETQQTPLQVEKSLPRGAGAWLTAGEDFSVKSSAKQTRSGIDEALDRAAEYAVATVFLEATEDGEAVVVSSAGDEVDILRYAMESASAKGFQPVVCVPAADYIKITGEGLTVDAEALEAFCQAYQPEVLLLSDLRSMDFSDWEASSSDKQSALTEAVEQLRRAAEKGRPSLIFGVDSSLVWSNEASGTKASYESLQDGFADVKSWMEEKCVDFVYLSSASLTADQAVPLQTMAAWWNELAVETGAALYMGHRVSASLATETNGLLPDELASQMSIVAQNGAFFGSVLDSVSALEKAQYGDNAFVRSFLTGGVATVQKEAKLAVLNYPDLQFTAKKGELTFLGTSVPGMELTCNGKKVTQSRFGCFSYTVNLEKGKNTLLFQQEDQKLSYTITFDETLIRSVAPMSATRASGGAKLEITAVAVRDAKVYAKINGVTVQMKPGGGDEEEPEAEDSNFISYIGTYTLPKSQEDARNIGSFTVYVSYDGRTAQMKGGSVTVNAKPPEIKIPIVEPDEPSDTTTGGASDTTQGGSSTDPGTTGGSGVDDYFAKQLTPYQSNGVPGFARMCEVTSDDAETLPGNTSNDACGPTYVPILKGTFDYIVEETSYGSNRYYKLKSGRRVYQEDVKEIPKGYMMPSNSLKVKSSATSGDTNITLYTKWKVPVDVAFTPQKYVNSSDNRPYAVNSFTAQSVDFVFNYTAAASGSVNLSGSNVFSKAEWIVDKSNLKTTLRLYLKQTGSFFGYSMQYNADGSLTISLKNSGGTSLSGYTIMLDPGHGGKDPGAGSSAGWEAPTNLAIAKKVQQKLQAAGATVLMTRSSDSYVELDARRDAQRSKKPDLFISIHCDAADTSSALGTTGYYYTPYSYDLANAIHKRLVSTWRDQIYKGTSVTVSKIDRGTRFYPFRVTRVQECPSVLIEYGFISNANDRAALLNSAKQDLLAQATVNGIQDYLNAKG